MVNTAPLLLCGFGSLPVVILMPLLRARPPHGQRSWPSGGPPTVMSPPPSDLSAEKLPRVNTASRGAQKEGIESLWKWHVAVRAVQCAYTSRTFAELERSHGILQVAELYKVTLHSEQMTFPETKAWFKLQPNFKKSITQKHLAFVSSESEWLPSFQSLICTLCCLVL